MGSPATLIPSLFLATALSVSIVAHSQGNGVTGGIKKASTRPPNFWDSQTELKGDVSCDSDNSQPRPSFCLPADCRIEGTLSYFRSTTGPLTSSLSKSFPPCPTGWEITNAPGICSIELTTGLSPSKPNFLPSHRVVEIPGAWLNILTVRSSDELASSADTASASPGFIHYLEVFQRNGDDNAQIPPQSALGSYEDKLIARLPFVHGHRNSVIRLPTTLYSNKAGDLGFRQRVELQFKCGP